MIIEKHYDDEILISFVHETGFDASADPHLAECRDCAASFAAFREIIVALRDTAVWNSTELADEEPPTVAPAIRHFAEQLERESENAERFVADLRSGPREQWSSRLLQNPQWRTAGMVRKLIEVNVEAIKSNPLDALELTGIAIDIADGLHSSTLSNNDVFRLRGGAWRERGYTLYYTGSHNEALAAIERAERYFKHVVVSEYDLARVNLIRSMILNELEHCEEAAIAAYDSAMTFRAFGDTERYCTAMITSGVIEMKRRAYRDAIRVFTMLEPEITDAASMHAGAIYHNIACSHRELREFAEAKRYFTKAVGVFDRQGHMPARLKSRWAFARILMAEGLAVDALSMLSQLRNEARELGMSHDLALISLDMAEMLFVLDRAGEVSNVCAGVMEYFRTAGLEQTQYALTALAYVKEAAAAGRLNRTTVNYVRSYIERLPSQPNLLFAPPPL